MKVSKNIVFGALYAVMVVTRCVMSPPNPQVEVHSFFRKKCIPKENVGNIHFDCNLEQSKYEEIVSDLRWLRTKSFSGKASQDLKDLLSLADTNGNTLFQWMEERIKYILSENYDLVARKGEIYAMNYGLHRFVLLLEKRTRFSKVAIPGHREVEVTSPRVGNVKLSKEFSGRFVNTEKNISLAQSIIRLGILLHEARHSDGNGPSLGFEHVKCPNMDDGRSNCDYSNNGPYTVEALFLKMALENCSECSVFEREAITLFIEDSEKRLNRWKQAPSWDERPVADHGFEG